MAVRWVPMKALAVARLAAKVVAMAVSMALMGDVVPRVAAGLMVVCIADSFDFLGLTIGLKGRGGHQIPKFDKLKQALDL